MKTLTEQLAQLRNKLTESIITEGVCPHCNGTGKTISDYEHDECDILIDKILSKYSTMKFPVTLQTIGCGQLSIAKKMVRCTEFKIRNAESNRHDDSLDDLEGDARVYFNTKDWNPKRDGLIYGDPLWLKGLRIALREQGLNSKDVRYSEQGLQGKDYVHIELGPAFMKSWIQKFRLTL